MLVEPCGLFYGCNMIDLHQMEDELIRDEGLRLSAYQDSLGLWTIGVGRLIDIRKGGQVSPEEARYLLRNDIDRCVADIENESWFRACRTESQRRALVNMRFQLGSKGIRSFVSSLGLVSQGRFKEAGALMRKSLWYKQTPLRAERVIRQLENGQ
jgi:lysozyme